MKRFLPTLLWGAALLALFLLDPTQDGPSLCLFRWVGLRSCPGCGLGHAVHYALRGQWSESLRAHWLGIPVAAALFYQAIQPLIPHNSQNHLQWTSNK
ncbi:DUF2752 domain-containing protein [Flaviaesturariibacter terrae]